LYLYSLYPTNLFSLRKISVLFLFFSVHLSLSGEDPLWSSPGAVGTGMGSVSATGKGLWLSFSNQALLAQNRQYSAGINCLNRYNITELGTYSAGFILPAGKSSAGILLSRFGYSEYSREKIGLACGMQLSEKISAGIQIDYYAVRTSNKYSNYQSLTFEMGILINLSDNISAGIHLFNPVPNSLRKSFLPSSLNAGVGIELSQSLFAAAEIAMSSAKPIMIKMGFDYEAVRNLHIRGGFTSENTSFSFGAGFSVHAVIIDIGFATHERLGVTTAASLTFLLRGKRNPSDAKSFN